MLLVVWWRQPFTSFFLGVVGEGKGHFCCTVGHKKSFHSVHVRLALNNALTVVVYTPSPVRLIFYTVNRLLLKSRTVRDERGMSRPVLPTKIQDKRRPIPPTKIRDLHASRYNNN